MAATRADRTTARNSLERGNRLGEMILLEPWLVWHTVLPHVISDLVAALHHRA